MRVARAVATLLISFLALPVLGQSLEWNGFALVRGTTRTSSPVFEDDPISSQLHLGLDWRPSVFFLGHLHLLARDDETGSRRGEAGIVEAYLQGNFPVRQDRLRITAGAFFLPTSRENVDALWETAYTVTPSALNSWWGEEFRPIGIDLAYTHRRSSLTAAVTVYRGNDTLGGLPVDRGWMIRDHWATLGEHLLVHEEEYTSVSAETDGRLGWSARARWDGEHALVQITHIDNRSDGQLYGDLLNWDTQFDLITAEYARGPWTVAAEAGWGPSAVNYPGGRFSADMDASYLLVSRSFGDWRGTLRHDWFGIEDNDGTAVTAAVLWSPVRSWRVAVEASRSEGDSRALLDFRYYFAGPR